MNGLTLSAFIKLCPREWQKSLTFRASPTVKSITLNYADHLCQIYNEIR